MLIIIAVASAGVMAAAWFYLKQSKLPDRMQGALFVAASFGAVAFLGYPMSGIFRKVISWTGGRVGIEFFIVANIILLLTVGVFLLRQYGGMGRSKNPVEALIKEPIFIAAVVGIVVGLMNIKVPTLLNLVYNKTLTSLFPLMLITLGLSLNWHPGWNKLIVRGLIPVAAIKLLLLPVLVYAMIMMLGPIGKLTSTSLVLFAMMPSTLYGLVLCDRYKLETNAYAAAITFTTVIAVIMMPIVHDMKLF